MNCPNCGFRLPPGKIKKHLRRKPMTSWRGEHEYLAGILAHTRRRLEIFRNAGGEATWFDETDPASVEEIKPAMCQLCAETHPVGWIEGEWDHQCKLRKKCDAAKCSAFGCMTGHIARHGRFPKWSGHADRNL